MNEIQLLGKGHSTESDISKIFTDLSIFSIRADGALFSNGIFSSFPGASPFPPLVASDRLVAKISGLFSYTEAGSSLSAFSFQVGSNYLPVATQFGVVDEFSDSTRGYHVFSTTGDTIRTTPIMDFYVEKIYSPAIKQSDFRLIIGKAAPYQFAPIYLKNLTLYYV